MLSSLILAASLATTPYLSSHAQLELDVDGDLTAEVQPVFDTALYTNAADSGVEDGGRTPEPDYQRRRPRRRRRRGKYKPKYRKRERTLGFSLQTGMAIPIGKTIGNAYNPGAMAVGRFNFHLGDSTMVFFEARWSYHVLKSARPMFFRTSVTPSSSEGGTLHTVGGAAYYGYSIPLGYGFQNRARINPKFYFGIGPDFTFAQAFITNTGQKGTVRGEGTQAFLAFIPGLGLDIRLNEFFFLGIDVRHHFTLPLARPSVAFEFTIPRMQLFEAGASLSYYFY